MQLKKLEHSEGDRGAEAETGETKKEKLNGNRHQQVGQRFDAAEKCIKQKRQANITTVNSHEND